MSDFNKQVFMRQQSVKSELAARTKAEELLKSARRRDLLEQLARLQPGMDAFVALGRSYPTSKRRFGVRCHGRWRGNYVEWKPFSVWLVQSGSQGEDFGHGRTPDLYLSDGESADLYLGYADYSVGGVIAYEMTERNQPKPTLDPRGLTCSDLIERAAELFQSDGNLLG